MRMDLRHPTLDKLIERRRFGVKPGLGTIRALMAELGDPQDALKCIHVAGTNGKGSVVAKTDAVLRAAGFRTARYTSPHLVSVNERFFIEGSPANDGALESAAAKVLPAVERIEARLGTPVTFFESLTAVAFVLFSEVEPDAVVLETGLGGRLDATNVIVPQSVLASVFTRIGLDHCAWLGNTVADIAAEKAGIIKRGRPVAVGAQPPEALSVISAAANENGCPVYLSQVPLLQGFVKENEETVRTVISILRNEHGWRIDDDAVAAGLRDAVWPGRFQHVVSDGADVYVDGAHNPDGAAALKAALESSGARRPFGLIAGFCGDKDVLAHLRILAPDVSAGWSVPIRNERSLDPERTAAFMREAGIREVAACRSLVEAIEAGKRWLGATGGTLVVCGSLFLAGEALVALGAYPWSASGVDQNESISAASGLGGRR